MPQKIFSLTQHLLPMVSPEMQKKTGVGPFILELFTKNEKMCKKWHFFTDFSISKNVNISGLVIGKANPKPPVERFVQARRFAPKFSSLKGH